MNAQILIKTANDWFEFTKSKTGQLDYVGKWEKNALPDVKVLRNSFQAHISHPAGMYSFRKL